MLDWLGKHSHKTDHPMYCIEEAERLLTGLSDDPLKALEEITSWLTTLTQAAGFQRAVRLAVIKLVDETGSPYEEILLRRSVTDRALSAFERQVHWDALDQFSQRVLLAYKLCLDEMQHGGRPLPGHHPDCALALVRSMRALGRQLKLRQLRYLWIGEAHWEALFSVFRLAEQAECDMQRVTAYPDEPVPTTVRHELLRALLLVLARPESMTPRETEIAARIAARYADACVFDDKARDGLIWEFDPTLPRGPELAVKPLPSIGARFFGAAAVTAKIHELIRRLNADPGFKEQRFGEDFSREEKLAVLNRVANYWCDAPPQSREYRTSSPAALDVTRGYANACRQIPRVQYRDWSELIAGLEIKILARLNIVADPDAPAPPVPVEQWQRRDTSAWGLSAEVSRPAENEIELGSLCAFKTADGVWSAGTVRRLVRDADERLLAGIEIFAKKPATVLLRRIGHGGMSVQHYTQASNAAAGDYMNSLLLAGTREEKRRHELLLPRGEFIAGIIYEAMIGEARQQFKVEELIERGVDFDRVRFTRVKRTPA